MMNKDEAASVLSKDATGISRIHHSAFIIPHSAFVLIVLTALASSAFASQGWKPAEKKDDAHWYPEMPEGPINETLINGSLDEAGAPEKGALPHPKGWAHPDNFCITWAGGGHPGKCIMLDTQITEEQARKRQQQMRDCVAQGVDVPPPPSKAALSKDGYEAIGGTYGVSFYSEKFKCKPKQAYKISFDYMGPGGGAKVWVRGWGMLDLTNQKSMKELEQEKEDAAAGKTAEPVKKERDRKLFDTWVGCYAAGDGWRHFEQPFHPTRRPAGKDKETGKPKYGYAEVHYLRIMLYAYWPPTQYHFDNIKVEEISDEEYERLKAIPADRK